MMGRYLATAPACTPSPLPGTVVDITLTDMGRMMGPSWNGPKKRHTTRQPPSPKRPGIR
jgi:hypothetical protein